jgi:hypothetical protein
MKDVVWGLDKSHFDTAQIRVFGNLSTSQIAPQIELPSLKKPIIVTESIQPVQ